jgi:hypothetical protein
MEPLEDACRSFLGTRRGQRRVESHRHLDLMDNVGLEVAAAHRRVADDEAFNPRDERWRKPGRHTLVQLIEAVIGLVASRSRTPGHDAEVRPRIGCTEGCDESTAGLHEKRR